LLSSCPADTLFSYDVDTLALPRRGHLRLDEPGAARSHRPLRGGNRILRKKPGRSRIVQNEPQEQGLATAAAKLGWDLLRRCDTLFGPDTPVRCRRWLVVQAPAGATQ
jgi:hypothetical protein